MNRLGWTLIAAVAVWAAPAFAQTAAVDSARAAGAVGERYDGYAGIAAPVSPAVRSQVSAINIKRRSLYTNLAAAKGVSPSAVGLEAACQLLERVGPGQSYMLEDGVWRRRAAGQPAPVPAYCR